MNSINKRIELKGLIDEFNKVFDKSMKYDIPFDEESLDEKITKMQYLFIVLTK
jgi:hypothetical protein